MKAGVSSFLARSSSVCLQIQKRGSFGTSSLCEWIAVYTASKLSKAHMGIGFCGGTWSIGEPSDHFRLEIDTACKQRFWLSQVLYHKFQ